MVLLDVGPKFIGIGVQRGGTSWLYECLKEHPQTYIPTKEVHFFDSNYELGTDWYRNLFRNSDNSLIPGEYTPDYLASELAIRRIYDFDPSVKLILILREPLARAYSAYKLYKSHGRFKKCDFNAAMEKDAWIIEQSMYSKKIEYLLSLFPRDNVYIDFYERLEEKPSEVFSDVCEFIGINSSYRPNALYSIRNASVNSELQSRLGLVKAQNILMKSGFVRQINWIKNLKIYTYLKNIIINKEKKLEQARSSESRIDERIILKINEDVVRLEEILGVNLDHWKSNYRRGR